MNAILDELNVARETAESLYRSLVASGEADALRAAEELLWSIARAADLALHGDVQ